VITGVSRFIIALMKLIVLACIFYGFDYCPLLIIQEDVELLSE